MNWIPLILYILLQFPLSELTEDIFSPKCFLKNSRYEMPCHYFHEKPYESLSHMMWTEQQANKTFGQFHYRNITINLEKTDWDAVFLIILYESSTPFPQRSWEVQPVKRRKSVFPAQLIIAYIPGNNETTYDIRRVYDQEALLEKANCSRTETVKDCEDLRTAKLFMRQKDGNAVALNIFNEGFNISLSVEFITAACNITCRGVLNNCSKLDIKYMEWESPLEELKAENFTAPLTGLFYCARIQPSFHHCCVIYTQTLYFYHDVNVDFAKIELNVYISDYFLVFAAAASITFFVIIFLKKFFGGINYMQYYFLGIPEGNDPKRCQNENDSCSFEDEAAKTNDVEILLVYSKESKSFQKLMDEFRQILSFYVAKVWDPYDVLEIEKVSENPSIWLEKVLGRKHIKVILIENKYSAQWYETLQNDQPLCHLHHLDSLFFYTVNLLHNTPYLCHNYKKLFIVSFSFSTEYRKVTSIVPCTRYEIPRHLWDLITDLIGSCTLSDGSAGQPLASVISNFEELLSDYLDSPEEDMTNTS